MRQRAAKFNDPQVSEDVAHEQFWVIVFFFWSAFEMCHKYLKCALGFEVRMYSVYLQFAAFTTHLIKTGSNLEMGHIVCVRAQKIFERHVSSNDEHLPITKGSSWKCLLVITGKTLNGSPLSCPQFVCAGSAAIAKTSH